MSTPSLFIDNEDKAWANFYLNSLKVYNGITYGKGAVAAQIQSVDYYNGDITVENNAPVNQADVTIDYIATVTTYANGTFNTKIILDFGQNIQGRNGTDAITTTALPEPLRPAADTFVHAHALIHDNNANPSAIRSGSVYLA